MPGDNIVDLEGLLKQYIGENKEIIDIKKERLTSPGENYCSIMLKLDITVRNLQTGKEEEINAVAKTVNTEVNEFFKKAAHPQFKKEIAFYTEIVPALQQFQREQGVDEVLDLFPKVYAARKNIHGNDDEIDDDSVIIMENLKVQGYSNIDRVIGFDLEGAKLVLKDLAVFHAVPIALKLKKFEVFEEKVKKHCFKPFFPEWPKPEEPMPRPEWFEYIEQQEECEPYVAKVNEIWKVMEDNPEDSFLNNPSTEPFASILHGDMWCNNSMQKSENNKLIANKLLDFQIFTYAAPLCDLIFFIFSSIQYSVVKEHYEDLIKLYHEHFFNSLERLGCETTPFEYSKFLERIEEAAPYEFLHLLFMAIPIHCPRGEAAMDMEEEDWTKMVKEGAITEEAKKKISKIVYEFGIRDWIRKTGKVK